MLQHLFLAFTEVTAVLFPPPQVNGEVVRVAFSNTLNEGLDDWRTIHLAKLSSYCVDQDSRLYDYKHTNLEYAEPAFTVGD
ncbi:hypothetical protein ABSL23_15655 (plasmid) [Halobacterium sp. NMX12-1]|uniref:DUF7961 domain-containing protein n=1 Tax=Halobacterium sp. NMX12-1 TaxID=3166650 RepID=A0AAU8CGP4_9EURY